MKKLLIFLLFLGIAWFLLHTLVIVGDGLNDEKGHCKTGVIFGNTVNVDGSLSVRLQKRLDKGIELFRDSLVAFIFVSGGLGKEGFYEGIEMQKYLIKNHVPSSRIIVDNNGVTTEATALNFKKLHLTADCVVLISQYHHLSRAKLAFRKNGFKDVKGVHADYFEWRDGYSIVREFFGYYSYLLK